ncbi:MAG: glycosyltransferase [Candidatus Thermoplasmatota archaeon]|nr:glycosyltransferase [Candidatus Thermoplasmatota archaeon]
MKLLWITHRRQSEMSATTQRGVASALKNRGWEIEFMSPDGQHRVERSTRLGRGHQTFNRSIADKLHSMELGDYCVAIAEWTGVEGASGELSRAQLPWIIMDRSPPITSGIIGWIQRKQYNKAWGIAKNLSKGRAVKSSYMGDSQDWQKPSAIVPAGVDTTAFVSASMNDNPLVVCHGSLDRSRELNRLTKMGVDLLLFGEGNDSQRLSNMARVEGPGDVASRLSGADVGVLHLPNRDVWRHASPLKVAEYAAAGLPVVASEVSGLERYRNAEWLKLIPLGDDEACKTALHTLCNLSLDERRRLGALARQEAERSMTWENCTEALHEMLLEVKR